MVIALRARETPERFVYTPQRRDLLWGPSSLLSNGYLHLVSMSRLVELYLQSPVCLHGILLNELGTGTPLPILCRSQIGFSDLSLCFTVLPDGRSRFMLIHYSLIILPFQLYRLSC
jgi:hypothetical protein